MTEVGALNGVGYSGDSIVGVEENDAMLETIANIPTEHYMGRGGIQPIDFIVSNGMDFLEGNVVKYVYRYKFKGGVGALEKAKDYIEMLIKREFVEADK